MSAGINRATLMGNLGEAPELRFTQSNTAVLKFRMATSESVRQDDGTFKDFTQWHNVVVWGKRGESLSKLLAKGSRVYVEGRIETRSYDNKDGEKRWVTEISAQNVILLDGKRPDESSGDHSNAAPAAGTQQPQQQPQQQVRDIPF